MRDWLIRTMAKLRGRRPADDLIEEMGEHLQMEIDERVESGMSPEDARRGAHLKFGNATWIAEESRAEWRFRLLEDFWQDARRGARMLLRNPGFTAVAVMSLAIGIGTNTAIFSLIDALILRKLPVPEPQRLVLFRTVRGDGTDIYDGYSISELARFRGLSNVLSGVSAICLLDRADPGTNARTSGVDAGLARVALVSGDYFNTLGVTAAVGRTLAPADDVRPAGHPLAVISDAYWEREFSRAPDVLGRTFSLNRTTYTIIGVMPRGFSGDWPGRPADLWIPTMMQSQVMVESPGMVTRGGWLRIVAQLGPGVSRQRAEAALRVLYHRMQQEDAEQHTNAVTQQGPHNYVELVSGAAGYSPERESFAFPLALLTLMAALLLAASAANVANLSLARASARTREMALRLAIGAGRERLVRQLFTESILVALAGGAVGLVLASWGANSLSRIVGSGPVQLDSHSHGSVSLAPSFQLKVYLFTLGISVLTAVAFGLTPAFRGSKAALATALQQRGNSPANAGGGIRARNVMAVAQVALSIVLATGAGLMLQTVRNLKAQDLGVDVRHLLLVWTMPGETGRVGPALAPFCRTVRSRLAALPGVRSVGLSNQGFLMGTDFGGASEDLQVEGRPPKPGLQVFRNVTTPGTFEAAGIPLLAGRDFTENDREDSTPVAIIYEKLAQFYFGSESPVGRHLGFGVPGTPPVEIVGVVGNARYGSVLDDRGVHYRPCNQLIRLMGRLCIMVRAVGNPLGLAASVRRELRDIDPSLRVLQIDTVSEQLDAVLYRQRMIADLATVFALVAFVLVCVGVYGLISYTTSRRTAEIGIRVALGATPADVGWAVLREGLVIATAGILIGVAGALVGARILTTTLVGVGPADPVALGGASLCALVVALAASWAPARRATGIDPMTALRQE